MVVSLSGAVIVRIAVISVIINSFYLLLEALDAQCADIWLGWQEPKTQKTTKPPVSIVETGGFGPGDRI